MNIKIEEYNKYLLLLIILLVFLASYLIIKPYLLLIVSALILTYIFYPAYAFLKKHVKNRHIASLLCVIMIILLITIPLVFVISSFANEAYSAFTILKQKIEYSDFFVSGCNGVNSFLCSSYNQLNSINKEYNLQGILDKGIIVIGEKVSSFTYSLLISIPLTIINILIMLFVIFFLFIEGEAFATKVREILPFEKNHKQQIIKKLTETIDATVYGQIIVALVQGITGTIGFYIMGISNPILWGSIMALLSLMPYVGTALVWVPASLYLFINGILDSNNSLILKGTALFFYGLIVVSNIDNVIQAKIIGKRAKIHPLVVFFGILGGLSLFGIIGIILGPVFLTVCITLFDIYASKKKRN